MYVWGGQTLNKKAFTLIELLAVIVILAIIALIATPIIIGIINDAKKQSNERSAELYLKAAELAIARENLNGELNASSCDVQEDGNLKCNGKDVKVEMDGEKPKSGKLTFSNGKITTISNLNVSGKYINKTSTSSEMVISDTPEEEKTFTGTIYRNSSEPLAIGDSIIQETKQVWCGDVEGMGNSCDFGISFNSKSECETFLSDNEMSGTCTGGSVTRGLTSYETEETKSNITQNYYLKHEVEDNIVTASYACIRYTEDNTLKEVCVQGGNSSYYGGFDEMEEGSATSEISGAFGNIEIINSTKSYLTDCRFSSDESSCSNSNLALAADSNGNVYAKGCSISLGTSQCLNN